MPITATATVAPPPSHPHEILKTPKCCAASGSGSCWAGRNERGPCHRTPRVNGDQRFTYWCVPMMARTSSKPRASSRRPTE